MASLSSYQSGGVGSVVGIRIGSRVFHFQFSPTDDAASLLRNLGISATIDVVSTTFAVDDPRLMAPGHLPRAFVLRRLDGVLDMDTVKTFTGDFGEYLPDPLLEIVDINDVTFEVEDVEPDAVRFASIQVAPGKWTRP